MGSPAAAFYDLGVDVAGLGCYMAGLPRFPRVFARDSLKSALLLDSPKMLGAILELCATKLGRRFDRLTGEEPGKVSGREDSRICMRESVASCYVHI